MGHHRCPEQYSCPLIDSVIEHLEVIRELGMFFDDDGESLHEHYEATDLLEEIRKVNHGLREWGCDEARQRDALEAELSCVKEQVQNLLAEVRDNDKM